MLLAIDGAGAGCSAALGEGAGSAFAIPAVRASGARGGHADYAIALVDDLLDDAGIAYDALDLIAVNVGPGSFTGVRTAVAAARGLALAAALPVLPVTGFEALAAGLVPRPGVATLVALDARRGEVYVQRFDDGFCPVTAPAVATPAAVAASLKGPVRLTGGGAASVRAALPRGADVALEPVELDAVAVARCAALRLAGGARPIAGCDVRPLYLRGPDARPPTSRRSATRA